MTALKKGETVEFKCPFCGLTCAAGNLPFSDGSFHYGTIHQQPICDTFNWLDPDEFIAAVNDATLPPKILARLNKERGRT